MKRILFFITFAFCVILFKSQIAAETSLRDTYKIGTNDVLDIRVIDHDELRTITSVTSDGNITFPYIGSISVKGLSLLEIEQTITKRLNEGYIKSAVVAVSLAKSMSKKILLVGEFQRRGDIVLEENITVLRALSIAGGVTQNGMFGKLKIRREKKGSGGSYMDIAETELKEGLIEDKKIENMPLQPDDILIVEQNKTILIQGEVVQHGRIVLEKDMTVLRALLQAGGASKDGLYGILKIRRKQEGKKGEYKDIAESMLNYGVIENKEVEDMLLEPDDILIIEQNRNILIQGEASQRGRVVLEKDMTVLRALLQVGGVSKDGLYGMLKIRRKQEGEKGEYKDIAESMLNYGVIENKEVEDMLLEPDDILIIEQNRTILVQGEASQRGRVVLEKDMTVLRALLQVGGVSKDGLYGMLQIRRKQEGKKGEYKDIAESMLNYGAIENKEVEDMLLEPDDILNIEQNKNFLIYGELNRTGEFILTNDMTVFKALTNAGGFTKWGSPGGVKILRQKPDGSGYETIKVNIKAVINGDAAADVLLKPKDIIIVSSGIL